MDGGVERERSHRSGAGQVRVAKDYSLRQRPRLHSERHVNAPARIFAMSVTLIFVRGATMRVVAVPAGMREFDADVTVRA